jgi:hypothetical protein
MTIKFEQDVLLRVLERPTAHSPLETTFSTDDSYCLSFRKQPFFSDVENLRGCTCDDDDSIFTASTDSLSDTDSELDRRVSFADDLVTEEWTRPFTPKEEVNNLFYSSDDTARYVELSTDSTCRSAVPLGLLAFFLFNI